MYSAYVSAGPRETVPPPAVPLPPSPSIAPPHGVGGRITELAGKGCSHAAWPMLPRVTTPCLLPERQQLPRVRPGPVCQGGAAQVLQAQQHGQLRAAAQHVRLPEGGAHRAGRPGQAREGRHRVPAPVLPAWPGAAAREHQEESDQRLHPEERGHQGASGQRHEAADGRAAHEGAAGVHGLQAPGHEALIQFLISLVQSNRILGVKRKIPLMLNDGSSAHSMPKYGRQYSLEHVPGAGPYAAPAPAYSGSSLYAADAVASSGPIISDITELAPSSPLGSSGVSADERPLSSSSLVRVKEEPPSPPRSPRVEEASPGRPSSVDTPLSPTTFIDSILRESEPAPTAASASALPDAGGRPPSPSPRSAPEKCLSVACLDNVARAPQMSGVARLFPCPSSSSLHGRVQPGNELSDHLDAMDSNLDNLQTMLTSHGFSVDTSALLDIQELLSPQEPPRPLEAENSSPDSGKQLVHYTAQPLLLLDPDAVDTGSSELPVLFELGEGSYFSEGDDYSDDPTISLLTGSEPPKAKDPAVS
uniref:Heat shock transcription factor 1 n=1 Tax=Oryctolagus cuniculus TaxID=9986 RepID=A0A5F9C7C0_RABIT